ncbi:MAG: hypothetical protein LBM39_00920 [Candidatus Methanoplasma sp.]|jgi:hypothetical protein|nr:hypothetical protein [Candidatus Methanoplasma sp.]
MRKSPQDIVRAISYALKEGKTGDEFEVSALSKSTGMHYMTVSSYLTMIEYIQNNIPKVCRAHQSTSAGITILQELDMSIPGYEKLILDLFDLGAFNGNTAASLGQFDDNDVEDAKEKELIIATGLKCYLSRKGIMDAMDLADEREDRVLFSDMQVSEEPEEDSKPEYWNCSYLKHGTVTIDTVGTDFREVMVGDGGILSRNHNAGGSARAETIKMETAPTAT